MITPTDELQSGGVQHGRRTSRSAWSQAQGAAYSPPLSVTLFLPTQPTGPTCDCGFSRGNFLAPAVTLLESLKMFNPSVMLVS